ncbi:MAG: hypothetical protein EOP06_19630 [Proteobacteria bacterium]|nr:MAG: hypothetical protein EOP06_19630 [Pseudomonadota bacterium]
MALMFASVMLWQIPQAAHAAAINCSALFHAGPDKKSLEAFGYEPSIRRRLQPYADELMSNAMLSDVSRFDELMAPIELYRGYQIPLSAFEPNLERSIARMHKVFADERAIWFAPDVETAELYARIGTTSSESRLVIEIQVPRYFFINPFSGRVLNAVSNGAIRPESLVDMRRYITRIGFVNLDESAATIWKNYDEIFSEDGRIR